MTRNPDRRQRGRTARQSRELPPAPQFITRRIPYYALLAQPGIEIH